MELRRLNGCRCLAFQEVFEERAFCLSCPSPRVTIASSVACCRGRIDFQSLDNRTEMSGKYFTQPLLISRAQKTVASAPLAFGILGYFYYGGLEQ